MVFILGSVNERMGDDGVFRKNQKSIEKFYILDLPDQDRRLFLKD